MFLLNAGPGDSSRTFNLQLRFSLLHPPPPPFFLCCCLASLSRGHANTVWKLTSQAGTLFSADGKGVVKVWDMENLLKGCLHTLEAHTEAVSGSSVSGRFFFFFFVAFCSQECIPLLIGGRLNYHHWHWQCWLAAITGWVPCQLIICTMTSCGRRTPLRDHSWIKFYAYIEVHWSGGPSLPKLTPRCNTQKVYFLQLLVFPSCMIVCACIHVRFPDALCFKVLFVSLRHLLPSHQIQAMATNREYLFTAGSDESIISWDLRTLKKHACVKVSVSTHNTVCFAQQEVTVATHRQMAAGLWINAQRIKLTVLEKLLCSCTFVSFRSTLINMFVLTSLISSMPRDISGIIGILTS